MYRLTARALLLLMLVTVFGQVTAQACVEKHGQAAPHQQAAPAPGDMHGDTAPANTMDHCGDTMTGTDSPNHCGDTLAASEDCGQECSCCPGHCASALPVADNRAPQPLRALPHSTYREIASSPLPESEFRPPITA